MVESFTGTRSATCPWSVFRDDENVIATLKAYPFFESGQLDFALGDDPPNILVESLEVYHTALNRTRSKQDERRAREREHAQRHAEAVSGAMGGRHG